MGGIIVAVTLLIIMRAQMSVSQARIFTKNEVYTIGWDRGRAMELRFCKKEMHREKILYAFVPSASSCLVSDSEYVYISNRELLARLESPQDILDFLEINKTHGVALSAYPQPLPSGHVYMITPRSSSAFDLLREYQTHGIFSRIQLFTHTSDTLSYAITH
ncbi:MAG: hypothetical protein LRY41_02075 [Candidatus Pacebacteria bacterium]|nr:hypothetical protein [Candidatus Paceibacterota bacterium]